MHQMDGPYIKLRRAKQHLEAIKNMAERLKKDHPYRIVHDVVGQGQSKEYVWKIEQTGELAPDISFLVGDCCNNLRSALDYLIWQLWILQFPNFAENVYFPICDCETKFRSGSPRDIGPRKVAGVVASSLTSNQMTIIESVQPYKTGNPILSMLRDVNDCDKHRLVQVISIAPHSYNISVQFDQSGALIQVPRPQQVPLKLYRGTKIESGAMVARMPLSGFSKGTKMSMYCEIQVVYAFEGSKSADGKPIASTLLAMYNEVSRIITKLEPEFASFGTSKFK